VPLALLPGDGTLTKIVTIATLDMMNETLGRGVMMIVMNGDDRTTVTDLLSILAGGATTVALDGVGGFQGTVWGLCETRLSRPATTVSELLVQMLCLPGGSSEDCPFVPPHWCRF
jgi:hypothetical protein